jgi:hypothetical protein
MDAISHPDDFERSDADPRLVAALALGTAIFLLISPFFLRVLYPASLEVAGVPRNLPRPQPPVLEVHPKQALANLRSREDAALRGYGWIDRDHKVVRIPIDRATDILSQRGLPGWPAAAAPASR